MTGTAKTTGRAANRPPVRSRGFLFGPRLRELRGDRSLFEAARQIGIYPSTLMRLEKQERGASDDVARRVGQFYGVSLEELAAK